MTWFRRLALGLGTTLLLGAGLATPGQALAADTFVPGSSGLGDPFFPLAGNGGYDVSHYTLRLSYEPRTHRLVGSATISATATQNLSRFDLELQGLTVRSVTIDGRRAAFTRRGQELVITPAEGLWNQRIQA